MASISRFISDHHPDAYPADSVLDALQAREDIIIQGLFAYGTGRGLPDHEIENALRGVGLLDPEPEPENQDDRTRDYTVDRLEDKVNSLIQFARRHGFDG